MSFAVILIPVGYLPCSHSAHTVSLVVVCVGRGRPAGPAPPEGAGLSRDAGAGDPRRVARLAASASAAHVNAWPARSAVARTRVSSRSKWCAFRWSRLEVR